MLPTSVIAAERGKQLDPTSLKATAFSQRQSRLQTSLTVPLVLRLLFLLSPSQVRGFARSQFGALHELKPAQAGISIVRPPCCTFLSSYYRVLPSRHRAISEKLTPSSCAVRGGQGALYGCMQPCMVSDDLRSISRATSEVRKSLISCPVRSLAAHCFLCFEEKREHCHQKSCGDWRYNLIF